MKAYRLGLGLCLMVLIAGCSTASKPTPTSMLLKMTENFSERMRWQDFQHAAAYVTAEERESFLAHWRDAEDLHVVGAQVDSIEMLDPEAARVNMTIEYYLLPSNTVRKLKTEQEWSYLAGESLKAGSWELVSGAPRLPELDDSSRKSE